MDKAACAGQAPSRSRDSEYRDAWFPDRGHQYVDAMETCFYCSVRKQCKELRDSIMPEYGVWAGKIQHRGRAARNPSQTKKAG